MGKMVVLAALVSVTCVLGLPHKSYAADDAVILFCIGSESTRDPKNMLKQLSRRQVAFSVRIEKNGRFVVE